MGLTEKEAAERLKAQGENTLGESRRTGPMRIFLGQFRDVMVMILLGATVISVLLGEISDAVTIILIVLLNAILGFVQEYRTENTLEALRSMTSPTAKCWRDGKLKEIDASQLVTGDVIELEAGDRIPADCAVLKAAGFFSDEALLTGESVAVGKSAGDESDTDNSLNKSNIVYCGASATKGTCRARVIATGMATQMGRISEMLRDIDKEPTPLQKRLGELGKVVAIICLVVCIAVFGAGVLRGENVFDMLMTGITIAIAAIPEGLPATVTIALALAVSRMLKQKALVNKLHSVETLGCTSVMLYLGDLLRQDGHHHRKPHDRHGAFHGRGYLPFQRHGLSCQRSRYQGRYCSKSRDGKGTVGGSALRSPVLHRGDKRSGAAQKPQQRYSRRQGRVERHGRPHRSGSPHRGGKGRYHKAVSFRRIPQYR
uniref:HAD-IC family P-type ATPase n=1 Tax=Ruminococcus flavefaciens TaxID=1265 RepID=UPI0026F2AB25